MESTTSQDLSKVNFEQLKRKCAFQSGKLSYENEYEAQKPNAKPSAKKVLKTAFDMPDVMPIQMKQQPQAIAEQIVSQEKEESKLQDALKLLPKSDAEIKIPSDAAVAVAEQITFNGKPSEEQMSKFEMVQTRKLTYDLPILIIYNPSSGKNTNLITLIETRLKIEKIAFELRGTQKKHDTYFFAKQADFSKYSMLVACGGDGSYHEVVNGMLARDDKMKLPIAMVPNGSGNDTCTSIGIKTLNDALDYIVNAEVIALDTVRVLMDYDRFEDIPANDEQALLMNCRHMLANASISMPARVANEAVKYKKCCGKNCYAVATLQEAMLGRLGQDYYEIEIDGVKMANEGKTNVNTLMVMFFNCKFTGGGMVVDPFACMNDGFLDITWLHDEKKMNLIGVADLLGKAKTKGATHIYDRVSTFARGRKIKVTYLGKRGKKEPQDKGWGRQLLGIDGEDLSYSKQLTFECMPGNVEFAFHSARFFKDNKLVV